MRTLMAMLACLVSCSESTSPASRAKPSDSPQKSEVIARGERYSEADYLVPGYVTLLDFYADW